MSRLRRPLVAANWKMNMLRADGTALAAAVAARAGTTSAVDILLCPPATILLPVADALAGSAVALGGQDCHVQPDGAYTGDLAARMLRDVGCQYVIVGHSERRTAHHETDAKVRAKAGAALDAGLVALVCVGETKAERGRGEAFKVVERQVRHSLPEGVTPETVVIAYEPVWAIGTGRTPTLPEINAMHAHIRARLAAGFERGDETRILYGGSVKASNAREVLALDDVDGALVGGASLKADEFWAIVTAMTPA